MSGNFIKRWCLCSEVSRSPIALHVKLMTVFGSWIHLAMASINRRWVHGRR